MSSFVVEVNDFNGRQGVLDIGEGHVMTPAYVPSSEVYTAIEGVPGGNLCTEHCVSESLEELYGCDKSLSGFCDCPVCRNLTIGDAVTGLPDLDTKNHLHRAFAYDRESRQYQQALKQNETDHYIDTKPYAAEIIRRTAGPLCCDAFGR